MKLLIQLTFNNGLGNLYCGTVEILHFVQKYKDLGYYCELIFASNGTMGSNKFINFCEFEEIFDLESFKVFDRIRSFEHSTNSKIFEGYTYHSTQYGPDTPGAHWWDVFFDELPEEVFPKHAYNMETLMYNQHVPIFLPKFNKEVYDRVDKFKGENLNKAIQVRFFDFNIVPSEDFIEFSNNLLQKLSTVDTKFYFTSNNQYIIDKLKELHNIKTYIYKNLDEFPNDHGYYFYYKTPSREILLDRIYDNLTEMVLLSSFDELFYFTSFSWNSTFLYYSRANNPQQKLTNIHNNLDLIQ